MTDQIEVIKTAAKVFKMSYTELKFFGDQRAHDARAAVCLVLYKSYGHSLSAIGLIFDITKPAVAFKIKRAKSEPDVFQSAVKLQAELNGGAAL